MNKHKNQIKLTPFWVAFQATLGVLCALFLGLIAIAWIVGTESFI
jgi:hypothetical protein